MSVISLWFLIFSAAVIAAYFALPKILKPWVLLVFSAVFYGCFGFANFIAIGASILSVYLGGLWIARTGSKSALGVTIGFNLACLILVRVPATSLIVPLGISFYTLQAISYLVDVSRRTIPAERNPARLALYLMFFPTIMQGPISRYGQLAPQLWTPHRFDYDALKSGLMLALWGFFKKMVIADRAAMLVNGVFGADSTAEGFVVLLGVLAYSLQIYADFSGCVDISRGIAQALGINLIQNFNHPYLATSIKDFWHRWHISLSSWLKDYIYIPLGGNRHGAFRKYLNILIVFAVSGLWHGTGVNFFIWGLLHGVYQVADGLTAKWRTKIVAMAKVDQTTFSFRLAQRLWTFALVAFAWIFFRAPTFSDACSVLRRLMHFNPWVLTDGSYLTFGLDAKDFDVLILSTSVLLVVSLMQERFSVRAALSRQGLWLRWTIYLLGIFGTLIFGVYGPGCDAAQFIYMQF